MEKCLLLKRGEKQTMISTLIHSLEGMDSGETFSVYHAAIVKVIGCEVLTGSREREKVIGRAILAYACAKQGMSENTIGRLMGRDHSTIHHLKKMVKDWEAFPHIFKDENAVYVQFLKEINNEIDEGSICEGEGV